MDPHQVTSLDQLRTLYREPADLVKAKKAHHIDEVTREFIESSPFFLLATSDRSGACDVSPRGGPPGQLVVLDDHRVAFPDLGGNNLVDSLINLIDNAHAGLLVLTPGRDETLRIDGSAVITTDPAVLDRWDGLVRGPKVAVVVTVESAFLHCAKAFRRSGLWDPDTWRRFGELPDHVEMFLAQSGLDLEPAQMRGFLEADYDESLSAERPGQATAGD